MHPTLIQDILKHIYYMSYDFIHKLKEKIPKLHYFPNWLK